MAEKRQHNATMNAKGMEDHLDDDTVRQMIESQGHTSILLVEVVHGPYVNALDGTQRISLIPGAVARVTEEHVPAVKRLLRALSLDTGGSPTLDLDADGAAPDPADAAAEVDAAATAAGADQVWDPVAERQDAAGDAADPEAPLPTGDAGDSDDGTPDGPWPGDEGYEAPGASDDLAAKRAKSTRSKAAGS